jgi:hypothetical protein
MIFGPVPGLSVVATTAFLARPTLFDIVTVSVCVLTLIPLTLLARKELRAERHVSPEMQTRYTTLLQLLNGASAEDVLVTADSDVAIMLVTNQSRDGSVMRSVLRFDREEFEAAGQDETSTPVVFEQFFLDPARPLVRHRINVIAVTRPENGGTRFSVVSPQKRTRWQAAKMDRLIDRLAADIPSVSDLDVLIAQVQSSTART